MRKQLKTALIESHSVNQKLKTLGARISNSQSDEIKFMKRWLAARGEPLAPEKAGMDKSGHGGQSGHAMDIAGHSMLMPGMLTEKQMEALKKAKGDDFDRLFLTGMIQHHNGALIILKNLLHCGRGQDAELSIRH